MITQECMWAIIKFDLIFNVVFAVLMYGIYKDWFKPKTPKK